VLADNAGLIEFQFWAPWDGNGLVHGEHHLTSGFVVPSGAHLTHSGHDDVFQVYVYGYLSQDE
jgi:hypothetical protein